MTIKDIDKIKQQIEEVREEKKQISNMIRQCQKAISCLEEFDKNTNIDNCIEYLKMQCNNFNLLKEELKDQDKKLSYKIYYLKIYGDNESYTRSKTYQEMGKRKKDLTDEERKLRAREYAKNKRNKIKK